MVEVLKQPNAFVISDDGRMDVVVPREGKFILKAEHLTGRWLTATFHYTTTPGKIKYEFWIRWRKSLYADLIWSGPGLSEYVTFDSPEAISLGAVNDKFDRMMAVGPPISWWHKKVTIRKPKHLWDYQKARVYKWERESVRHHEERLETVQEIEAFVRMVCTKEKRPIPRVRDGRCRRTAASHGGAISMPVWSRSKAIVLHELAHEFVRRQAVAHGPMFVRVYMDLLVKYAGLSRAMLERTAREFGVDFDPEQVIR
jgi:hypothetical protein